MLHEKFIRLDDLAAPTEYVAPPTDKDLTYVAHFRQVCQRYQINFAKADQDEREFVIRMAEKTFYAQRA